MLRDVTLEAESRCMERGEQRRAAQQVQDPNCGTPGSQDAVWAQNVVLQPSATRSSGQAVLARPFGI